MIRRSRITGKAIASEASGANVTAEAAALGRMAKRPPPGDLPSPYRIPASTIGSDTPTGSAAISG
jgi:hypothetical protein